MASSAHDEEKWKAYPNTLLVFGERETSIDLRKPLTAADRDVLRRLGLDAPFAVLTAENPCGINAEDASSEAQAEVRDERNRDRMSRLIRLLEERDIRYVLVDGTSPDGSYCEHSVAMLATREQSIALAKQFEQLAIFWYDGRDFWLYPAELHRPPERLPRATNGSTSSGQAA